MFEIYLMILKCAGWLAIILALSAVCVLSTGKAKLGYLVDRLMLGVIISCAVMMLVAGLAFGQMKADYARDIEKINQEAQQAREQL